MSEKKIIESSFSEDTVATSNEGVVTSNSESVKTSKETFSKPKKGRKRSKSKGNFERRDNKTNNFDGQSYSAKEVSAKDKYLDVSSASPLPTTTEFASDTGNAFATAMSSTNSTKDPVINKWKSTTTLIRPIDNDINRVFKAIDQLTQVVQASKTYAIDSPDREVMVDDTTIINDLVDERTPSNSVNYADYPDYNQPIYPRYAHRNYILNLSGSLPRAKTSTDNNGVETATPSILDKFNSASKKGDIAMTPVDQIAPLINDIGTATTTVTPYSLRHNKLWTYCTRFDKLGKFSATVVNYGYVNSVNPEYYLSHDQLNKSNVHEAMYDKITEYNIDNNSMLRAIVSLDALAVTMNSLSDYGTAIAAILNSIASAIRHQLRIAAQGGAVDSTFANLFLTHKLQLNTIIDNLLFFANAHKGIPMIRPVFDRYLEQSKPFKIKDTDATNLDNMVIAPTFTLATSDLFNFSSTNTTDNRTPIAFADSDKAQSTKDNEWFSITGDFITPIDPRFTVGFKTTVNAVTDHIPKSSFWDLFMGKLFSWTSLGAIMPLSKYSDLTSKTYAEFTDTKIQDLFTYLKDSGSGKPNLTLTEPSLDYDVSGSTKAILPHSKNNSTSATVIVPMISSTNITSFMYSFIKFVCDPINKSFIDKFISNLNRVKPYFKTLQEKIGFFDYYELLDDSSLAKIGFNLELMNDFEYNAERAMLTCCSTFAMKNKVSSSQTVTTRFNSLIYPMAANNGTTDYDKVITKHKRATLYIKNDGSTYTDPSRSAIRLVAYDSTKNQTGYTVGADNAICFNTDIVVPDISIHSKYIGHHILAYYAAKAWKNLYNLSLEADRLDFGWWNWNFYYSRGKNPLRPRFMQRGLVMNTEDGLFQSPVLNAYQLGYASIHHGSYTSFCNEVGTPLLSMAVDTDSLAVKQDSYLISFIRNKTGLWTSNTLRRFLLENIFNKDKGLKLIKLKYITN